jgi:hypothetical protein
MSSIRTLAATLCVLGCLPVASSGAQEVDLSGAWANQESACAKVFVKRGNAIAFSQDAELYGSGFVVEADRVRGPVASCRIRVRKQDGAVLHLMTTCADDVALESVQFSLKIEDKNRIVRIFPGIPELDRTYYRCSL